MRSVLGLSSYAYYWAAQLDRAAPGDGLTVWGLLEKAADLGLEVVQLCENVPLLEMEEASLRRLKAEAERRNILLEVGTRGLDDARLRACVEIARFLEARLLRLVPWSGSETRQPLDKDRLLAAVRPLLPACRRQGLTLAIENYFDLPDEELAAFVQEVDEEYVGVCLDTANSTGLLSRPEETARMLAPYVVSVHLKDFIVTKPALGYQISGAPLGQGWLNAPAVLEIIHQQGRQPHILLELWVEPETSYQATAQKEDRWVRESIAYAHHALGLGARPV